MQRFIFNLVVFLGGLIILTIYMHNFDPLLGDKLGPFVGAIILPILVGVVGSTVFSGPVAPRITLCGLVFPGAILVSLVLNAGEPRDPDSGIFIVLIALWTGALASIAAWISIQVGK